jgi:hypothetical protein
VVKELSSLRALTGIDPFASPAAALDFVAEAQAIPGSALDIASLDYLLRHVYDEAGGLFPADSSITPVLDSLKAGLQVIALENTFAPDPTGALTQARLAQVLAGADLAEAIAIIAMASEKSRAEQAAFIDEHFASFLDPASAKAQLLGPTALEEVQARYEYVLEPLLAYLKTTLGIQLVVQSIAAALGLDLQ